MIKKCTFFSLLFFCLSVSSYASGIEFMHGKWTDIVAKAKEDKKFIFVDFYATWCGPCKYMTRKVFTNPKVGDYFNQHFVSYKVDAEAEEPGLVQKMDLQAYPTLGFFDLEGDLVFASIGVLETNELLERAKQVVNYKKNRLAVEKNTKDVQVLKDYLTILQFENDDQAKQQGGSYLAQLTDPDFEKTENWFFIRKFGDAYDTKAFQYVAAHPQKFAVYGDEFNNYFKITMKKLMVDAIQQKDYTKVELQKKYNTSVNKALGTLKKPEDYYNSLIDIMYYDGTGQVEEYYDKVVSWVDTYNKSDYQTLCEVSMKIADKVKDPAKLNQARKYAEAAVALKNDSQSNYSLSYVYLRSGKKGEALKYAQVARDKAKSEKEKQFIEQYIFALQN